jgi:cyclic pyranopterin phosphate synthase
MGRRFSYLRVSLTEACNFRCRYCLPNGYKPTSSDAFLSRLEVQNLVKAFAEMGTVKVRFTGGEPTLRTDLVEIIRATKQIPGIESVALSTNGWNLRHIARDLKKAGLDQVNVSVDSLNRERFADWTGTEKSAGKLDEVLAGIDEALAVGIKKVKINAVLTKENFVDDFGDFQDWVRHKPVCVRFIELMPTAQNQELFFAQHIRSDQLRAKLLAEGWAPQVRGTSDGPATEFCHPEFNGRIGLIAPYEKQFCEGCNRLRVTSRGSLRLCLFGEGEHALRPLLQNSEQILDLQNYVRQVLGLKDASHHLPDHNYGDNRTFSSMGG